MGVGMALNGVRIAWAGDTSPLRGLLNPAAGGILALPGCQWF
jgi:hypothetical protein